MNKNENSEIETGRTKFGLPKETITDKVALWSDYLFVWVILICGFAATTFGVHWFKSPKWDLHNWLVFSICHISFFVVGALLGFILVVFGGLLIQKICEKIFGKD